MDKIGLDAQGIYIRRICTHAVGAWKWQAAFVVVIYRPGQLRDGTWVWQSRESDWKRSQPQLERAGLWAALEHGSAHNRALDTYQQGFMEGVRRARASVAIAPRYELDPAFAG